MRKKIIAVIVIIVILTAAFLIGTGFRKRTDVVLFDYSVAEDGTAISIGVQVPASMGHIRGFKDKGGGVKPHYLTFYSTFGGLNSSFGTVNTFVLELEPDDTEIYFNRANGGYELVLVKDEETGQWLKPTKYSIGAPEEAERNEWSTQEIESLFLDNSESDWKMVQCISAYDFAYDRVGVVLYTESDTEYINIAFMDEEGIMQHCGIEAVLDEKAEFAYHGNGEVTFNVCTKEGVKYKQKITFSKNAEGVTFVSESLE